MNMSNNVLLANQFSFYLKEMMNFLGLNDFCMVASTKIVKIIVYGEKMRFERRMKSK